MRKPYKFLTLLTLLMIHAASLAQNNRLSVSPEALEPGSPATLEVSLDNTDALYGFQCDISLPPGLKIARKQNGDPDITLDPARFSSNDRLIVNEKGGVCYLGAFSSQPGDAIEESSGCILKLPVEVDYDYKAGTFSVKNNKFVDSSDHDVPVGNLVRTIEVYPVALALDPPAETIALDYTGLKLEPLFTTENTTVRTLTWTSSDESVLTVSPDGEVTPVESGTAVVTAETVNGIKATCPIKVIKPIKALSVEPTEITLERGDTYTLTVTMEPADTTDKDDLTWESSDESVVTVVGGEIVAVGPGEAYVTAKCLPLTATCKVTVIVSPKEIVLDPSSVTMFVGDEIAVAATVLPEDTLDKVLTWTSADPEIATVDEQGVIKAISLGETEVRVRCGDVEVTCPVSVIPTPASQIVLTPETASLKVGESLQLEYEIFPADTTDKSVTWTSSSESIVTVDDKGVITAQSLGEATVTVTCGAATATCRVTVVPTPAESLTLKPESLSLKVGEGITLDYELLPEDTTYKTITWESENPDVATVLADGTVIGVSLGEVIVTATCGDVTATCKVTVVPTPVESISVLPTSASLKVGEIMGLTYTVLPADATDQTIVWTSSDPAVATVDEQGVITAVGLGLATITATCGDATATCLVTVVPTPAERIALSDSSTVLKVGETFTVGYEVLPEDTTDKRVTWTSENPAIATVDADGKITAVSIGETIVTVRCGDVEATCAVTVVPTPVERLILDPETATLKATETIKINCEVLPADATDKTVTWLAADRSVATVDSEGNVTAVSVGVTEITAMCGDAMAICTVTVIPTPAESIILNPSAVSIKVSEGVSIGYEVLPFDTTDKTVTWESADTAIATVDAGGRITGVALGETVVTATCGEAQATCSVTVVPTPVASLTLTPTSYTMRTGENFTLGYDIQPADATDKTISWAVDNDAVVSVDASGLVTALSPGEATVTLSCGGLTATCRVTVERTPVTGISLANSTLLMKVGNVAELNPIVAPADATDKSVSFRCADTSIATVDDSGIVTALAPGTTTITITSVSDPAVQAICTVIVESNIVEVGNISLDPTSVEMIEGDTLTLTATVTPENATDPAVNWASADPTIATVSATGEVTAIKAGVTVIYATTSNNLRADCTVTVIPRTIEVTDITLSAYDLYLEEGQTGELIAVIVPDNATDTSVSWTAADTSIATVDANGMVTAVKEGHTQITARTSNGKQAVCNVYVSRAIVAVSEITVTPDHLELTEGETAALTATVLPENATDASVTWVSLNPDIATVSATGLVTAVKAGETRILASSSNGKTFEIPVTVKAAEVFATGITLSNTTLTLKVGESADIIPAVEPANVTDPSVTWSSADPVIATVDGSGIVTGVTVGETLVTATTSNGIQATCTVTVIPVVIPVNDLTVTPASLEMMEGETATLTATVTPADATDPTVTWKSLNRAIATVDENGVVTATGAGQTVIYASASSGKTVEIPVTVKALPVEVMEISIPATLQLTEGETAQLKEIIRPDNATDKSVTWKTDDPLIALVDATGLVRAIAPGVTVVTVTAANGVSATCEVTVIPAIIPVEDITVWPESLEMTEGDLATLIATITPENATDTSVTWKSLSRSIATVDENGVVTAVGAGETVILASASSGKTFEIPVIVKPAPVAVTEISLTPAELLMREGHMAIIEAFVRPENADDKSLTWTSDDATIATVNPEGVVTAVKVGETVITATSVNGVTATCKVTVIPDVIQVDDITVEPASLEMTEGDTETLIATITPDNATDKTVTWKSLNRSIATVDENGTVTAVSAGETVILASASNGKTFEIPVKVNPAPVPVTEISIPSTLQLTEGEGSKLIPFVRPENADDKSVTWKSADASIATVDADGNVTAVKAGVTVITVTSVYTPTVSATCEVTVIPAVVLVESLTVLPESLEMTEGDTEALTATIAPDNATDKTVTWKSANRSVATVDENGNVTAVSAGETTILVSSSNGITVEVPVTVKALPVPVAEISIPSTLQLTEGEGSQIIAFVRPENADDKSVTWKSADASIATVDVDGNVTAIAPGVTTLTVTSVYTPSVSATCEVTVIPRVVAVESLTVLPESLEMTEGDTEALTATIAPDNATDKTVTWKSANRSVATVDENGCVTAVSAGETVILVSSSNGITVEIPVKVNPLPVPVTEISIPSTLQLTEGDASQLIAFVRPENADDKSVTWKSADASIATVDADGNVTAVAPGVTVITVTSVYTPSVSATCEVTVIPRVVAVEDITVNPESLEMEEGETATLTATITPDNATDRTVTWKSLNPSIASVDENGKVTAIVAGETVILASSSNGKTVEVTVKVNAPTVEVAEISLVPSEILLREGRTAQIVPFVRPENATDQTLTWTSADTAIATVDNEGNVTAFKVGETVITATSVNGVTATCKVTVIPDIIPVTDLKVEPAVHEMTEGETFSFTATISPDDATDKTLTWQTSNAAIASVDTEGKVTAVGAGTTTIYVSASNGQTVSCTVIVKAAKVDVVEITLTPSDLRMKQGDTSELLCIVRPDNASEKAVRWESSDESIATVDANGTVTAVAVGTAVITVTSVDNPAVSATCNVTVESNVIFVSSIKINEPSTTLEIGETYPLTATILPDDATDKTVIWDSSDDDVAIVDENGVVTAIGAGTATIYASSSNGLTDFIEITVNPAKVDVTEITLSPANLLLKIGHSSELLCIVRPDNASEKAVRWESSDPNIATVDANGTVTAIAVGTTTITVTSVDNPEVKATCYVTVESDVIRVESIKINEPSTTLEIGETYPLTATILPEDATDKTVIWDSSDDNVAIVDENGKVTAVGAGTVTIYASSSNGQTDSITITVNPAKVDVTGITLTPSELLLKEGDVSELLCIVRPDNAWNKDVRWESSDESIATVDANGTVTALGVGSAVITVTSVDNPAVSATCNVTVESNVIWAESIKINEPYPTSMEIDDTYPLTATIMPEDATDKTVIWDSSDDNVAIVDENGNVTAVGPGTVTIYASTSNGQTDSITITVNPADVDVTGVSLSNSEMQLFVGDEADLIAIVSPDDATDKRVTWSNDNGSIVSLTEEPGEGDPKVLLKAIEEGTAIITVTSVDDPTITATCTVTVRCPFIPVTGVEIQPSALEMEVGDTETLTAVVAPADATDPTVTWESSDTNVVTVSADGEVTAVGPGTATVYAISSNGMQGTCEVTVATPVIDVTGVTLSNTNLQLLVGDETDLTAIVSPADATVKGVRWECADGTVVEMTELTGDGDPKVLLKALKEGVTTITVTTDDQGKSATCTVTVINPFIAVTGISLDPAELEFEVGDPSVKLTATVEPANATDNSVTWESSDPNIATVSADGEVTPVAPGTATVYAFASNGMYAECKVTVAEQDIDVTGISLSNTELLMMEGDITDIIAIVHPDNATDKSVTWTCDDESGAIISIEADPATQDMASLTGDSRLVITAVKAGKAVITATAGEGVTATCTVTVIPVPVTAISIDPDKLDMEVGDSPVKLTATVEPANASDRTVTWESSDTNVATVSADGEVTPVAPGTATVYAFASNGMYAECKVTVAEQDIDVTGLSLSNNDLLMTVGDITDLIAIVHPDNATDKTVSWTCEDETIVNIEEAAEGRADLASVSGDSRVVVTALKAGQTKIIATAANGITAVCNVTVMPAFIAVTGISIDPDKLEMEVGDEPVKLTATVEPANATDMTVTWESSDTNVATVSAGGEVTPVASGTATIYAFASNGMYAECKVTVTEQEQDIDVTGLSLSNNDLLMTVGDITDLIAIVHPDNATDKTVSWTCEDETIVSIEEAAEGRADLALVSGDSRVVVTALKAGQTKIIATAANGITAVCNVTVMPAFIAVTGISVEPAELNMEVGDEPVKLTATVEPSNATDMTVTWESADTTVASVSSDGEVAPIAPGSTTVYAVTSNGQRAECKVTVAEQDIDVTGLSLSNDYLLMTEGDVTDLIAIVHPDNATDRTVTWTIDDETIVSVEEETKGRADLALVSGDSRVIVTALKAGETVITATASNGLTATCVVTVMPAYRSVTGISIDPDRLEMEVGETGQLTATVTPDDATDKTVTWQSSDTTIATVSADGEVTAIASGFVTIYAFASNGQWAECAVTVNSPDVDVLSLSLSNNDLLMIEGDVTDLIAIVRPDDATDKSVTWACEDETIVTIEDFVNAADADPVSGDARVIVTALKAGRTVITATASNGVTASCNVTVMPAFVPVTGIYLNESLVECYVGDVTSLIATIVPENATDKSVTWQTSDASVVTVSDNGEVVATGVGNAVVNASSSNGLTATCVFYVYPGEIEPTGITLSNTELLMRENHTADLIAIVYPFDATDKSVVWASDDESIVTVDQNGLVTAIKRGFANVTATTVNGLTALCAITVVPDMVAPAGISLNETYLELIEGDVFNLIATVTPEEATDKSVTWTSSNASAATVSGFGEVTAVKAGTAVIYASTVNGLTAICNVTVVPRVTEVESIMLNATDLSMWVGETEELIATIMPENATDKSVTWISNNPDIATVDGGIVTALKEGVATITAKSANGRYANCAVTVKARAMTPRQLLRKGDGTTSTFVILMDKSDAELAELGYAYVVGYTAPDGKSEIIAETPLRYCHTTPEIFHNPTYDFWAFAFFENEDGQIITSDLRHLDGSVEICLDPSVYGFNPDGRGDAGTDNGEWIQITPSALYITASCRDEMQVAVYTTEGVQAYARSYKGATKLNDVIGLDRFAAGTYVATVRCDGVRKSKRIVVR